MIISGADLEIYEGKDRSYSTSLERDPIYIDNFH